MSDQPPQGRGRPTDYREEFCDLARQSMELGFSKTATAGKLGVSKQTFANWCQAHPEFLAAVKEGETLRTLKLETDLLGATDGPTVTSRIFALKNAAPDEWRDKRISELTGADGGPIQTEVTSDAAFARLAGLLGGAVPSAPSGADSEDKLAGDGES